jgi:hypothetical protein
VRVIEPAAMSDALDKAISAIEMATAGVGAASAGYLLGLQHTGAVIAIYGATVIAAYAIHAALQRTAIRLAASDGQG